MLRKLYRFSRSVVVITMLAFTLVGCIKHPRSYFHEKEEVKVEMLSKKTFCNMTGASYLAAQASYNKIFTALCTTDVQPKALPAIAVAAIGVGIDQLLKYGAGKMKEEADKHAADFAGGTFVKDFWGPGGEIRYPIIRVSRVASEEKDDSPLLSYEFFLGLYIDQSNDFMWATPLQFVTKQAKPKVNKSKGELTTTTEISFDSAWGDKEGVFHKQNLAKFTPVSIEKYSLNEVPVYGQHTSAMVPKHFTASNSSSQPVPRVPLTAKFANITSINIDKYDGRGLLWVNVVVTEIDKSKLKKTLTGLSEQLDKNRDKIVGGVKDQLSGK